MSKEQRAALDEAASKFVHKIVTEVYGQRLSKRTLSATARRVVEALPLDCIVESETAPSAR